DLNGDGNQNDPFQITVTSNGQVHELPHVDLFPIESAIKVFFYSEYYAASDTEKTKPLSQTFSITSLRIHNVGSNGWYNARTGIVYPNYNYSYSFYNEHSTEEYGDYLPNNVEMTSTADNVTPGPGKAGNPIQWTAQTEIFPSDYRGAEGGGLAQVKPLILKVELDMTPDTGEEENQGDGTDEGEGTSETGEGETPGEGTDEGGGTPSAEEEGMTRSTGEVTNKVSIPIVPLALKVERGKRYNFYINVRSESIAITYTVSAWDADVSGDDIGGNQIDYATMPFTYSPTSGWENGGGGSDNIGGIQ
ncbi:MAG: hypothetical protein LBM20_06150, partial [Rikenellaceae bacterium]|nr:hypothetical protein [Rikenellaceae bacterium]